MSGPTIEAVRIGALTTDPALSCRVKMDAATVAEYAEAMRAGVAFPPIVVFQDGKGALLVADGHHRVAAATAAELAELPAELRQGGRREALLYAAGANAAHGLRRSTADKRRAVLLVLAAFPKWSDRKIAEACGVDHKTVGTARAAVAGEIPQPVGQVDVDRLVARLTKALARLLKAWPVERRAELKKLLDAAEG